MSSGWKIVLTEVKYNMEDFKVGDSVLITEGVHKGDTGRIHRIKDDKLVIIPYDPDVTPGYYVTGDQVEYYNPKYNVVTEVATVATDIEHNIRIQVNPDRNRECIPYFKVLNAAKLMSKNTRACRLHFMDSEMEYHTGDGILDWKLNNKDIKVIRNFMRSINNREKMYTNWQMACWLWNLEYGCFVMDDRNDYFNGKFDEEYKDHPSYVPSTQKMPETWIYDPPKSKK